jgi:hypothetical protein
MAVPHVTVIFPDSGPTGGRRLVQIMGGDFQVPSDPPALGVAPVLNPTVEVLFGGEPATNVQVASRARLFCVTPITPLDRNAPEGPVDVVLRNIDQDGDVIPGETVTVVNGYSYALPDLNALPECDLVRLVRTLLHQLKKQVLSNVSIEVHTDWSDAPAGGLTFISKVPAITLHGPDLAENRFYSINYRRTTTNPFGLGAEFFAGLRPPYTVDLEWELLGVTDRKLQNIALQGEVQRFFHRNKTIGMLADASDPTSDFCEWEMDMREDGQPVVVRSKNNSNIRGFRARFVIRGFDLDDDSMAALVTRQVEDQLAEGSVEEPTAVEIDEPEQLGTTYLPGPSPGD